MRRAFSFLTLFGPSSPPNTSTMSWFPLVGAVLGLVLGGVWWLGAKIWPALVAGGIVVLADLVLTGLLHVDGLADTGDGLVAPLSRERRLAAMRDPAVGAFGVVVVVVALLLRWASLSSLPPMPLVLCGLWCASRSSLAFITEVLPYARPDGIVKDFLRTESRSWRERGIHLSAAATGLVSSVGFVLLGRGTRGLAALGAELVAIVLVAWFSSRRIGGYTGDVLGAAVVIGETVGLLILATR